MSANISLLRDSKRIPFYMPVKPRDINLLVFVWKAGMDYYLDDTSVKLQSGDVFWCPANVPWGREQADKPVSYTSMEFQFSDNFDHLLPNHIPHGADLSTSWLLRMMSKQRLDPRENSEEMNSNLLMSLLMYLEQRAAESECSPLVLEIKNYIGMNLQNELTAEGIANYVHLSPSYCSSLFKKETGISLLPYIHKLKIENACRMLTETDRPIQDISKELGFQNLVYFDRLFKKHTNLTPTAYREIYRGPQDSHFILP